MSTGKFDRMFNETVEIIGDNKTIDFKESDIDSGGKKKPVVIPPKSGTEAKKQKQNRRIVTYLTENEYKAFIATFKPLDKVAQKTRAAILEYVQRRKSTDSGK